MSDPFLVSTLPDLVDRFREARLARGLSQAAVAGRLFVTHTAVSGWERGTARPAAGLLISWARVVGLPLWAVPKEEVPPADGITVLQLNLATTVLRLERLAGEAPGPVRDHLINRLVTCDAPRLRRHLTETTLAEMEGLADG